MNWGNLCLVLSLIGASFSALFFFLEARKNREISSFGKKAYCFFVFFTTLATGYLFFLFLTHRFEFSYIYQYSSSGLPLFYVISSFWVGQEGTFLLWLFFGAIFGLFLLKGPSNHKNHTLFFYLLIQIFLLVVLLKKSPFEKLPLIPPDGRGLNPLLQNFWMVIHPPIVFIGYAVLAIPFVYALSALIRNEYEKWTDCALPWVFLGCLFLGAGIFTGGYWAYKVLGWGGYWGWDPVENASLVPWIVSIILFHTILLEKNKNGLARTNLFLALFSFLLVIYGTFLTRSGVLAEFSVHSFTDLGINSYLILFMLFFLVISFGLILLRWKQLESSISDKPFLSKQSLIIIGSILLFIWAVLIELGTSSPMLTSLFSQPSQVGTSYYSKMSLPLWLLIVLLLSMVVSVSWVKTKLGQLIQKMSIFLSVSLVLLVLTVHFLGFAKAQYLVLLFFAFLIFAGNLFVLARKIKSNILARSDLLTHLGVGLMLIGIIISSIYSSSNRIVLPLSETKQVFGYNLTFLGTSSLKEKNFLILQIEKNTKKKIIQTAFYFSEYSQGIVREPYVMSELWGDLYLAPVELQEQAQGERLELEKGQFKDIAGYKIKFLQFEIASHNQTDFIQVGAVLEIFKGKEKQRIILFIVIGNDEQDNHRKVGLFNTKDYIYLEKIDADSKKIFLRIGNESKTAQPVLILEISKKPFIWTLWLGTVIVLLGFIVSAKNHFQKQTK